MRLIREPRHREIGERDRTEPVEDLVGDAVGHLLVREVADAVEADEAVRAGHVPVRVSSGARDDGPVGSSVDLHDRHGDGLRHPDGEPSAVGAGHRTHGPPVVFQCAMRRRPQPHRGAVASSGLSVGEVGLRSDPSPEQRLDVGGVVGDQTALW